MNPPGFIEGILILKSLLLMIQYRGSECRCHSRALSASSVTWSCSTVSFTMKTGGLSCWVLATPQGNTGPQIPPVKPTPSAVCVSRPGSSLYEDSAWPEQLSFGM